MVSTLIDTAAKLSPQGYQQGGLSKKGPSLFWTLTEGSRASFELSTFFTLRRFMKKFPKGDGHPVIFFPGFVAGDRSTKPMRKLFSDLGYPTYGWGLGRNLVYNKRREAKMLALLKQVYDKHGEKVSIIGWSLGGLFAREVAKAHPDYVRSVISLGSPISGDPDHSNAGRLYKYFNGEPDAEMLARMEAMNIAPPVPTTSIFTKADGIVAWKGSIQRASKTPSENIQVPASHVGLGVNPLVMYAIADRLAQADGAWKPFETSGFRGLVFGSPKL